MGNTQLPRVSEEENGGAELNNQGEERENHQQAVADNVSIHLHPSFRNQQHEEFGWRNHYNPGGMHSTGEDMVQVALLKQLRRDYTSSKDWPRFSGE